VKSVAKEGLAVRKTKTSFLLIDEENILGEIILRMLKMLRISLTFVGTEHRVKILAFLLRS
jgi:hypothetical protein